MLVGGDLGFPRLVLVVVVVLVFPVIGFVVRRKWRFAAARSEEIKRLLVLASEESARAELEANYGYGASAAASYSQQLQFQCAVCFCPTTTRCARCKAVRYCSGRCQIIHWRQGHKEECHPFTIIDPSNEGEGSSQKVLNQEEYESHNDSSESEGRHYAEAAERVETIAEEFSNPGNSEVMRGKDDIEVVVDGPNGSLSEPSMASSGFWDGTINSRRSRTDSSESVRDTMSGPRSSLGFSFDLAKDIVSPAPLRVFNTKTTISDDDPTTPGIKKHTDEAALLDELCKDDLKSRRSPSLPAETSMNIHVETCSDPRVLKSREIKSSFASAYCVSLDASDRVGSPIKDAKVVNNSPSLTSERSTNMATDTRSSSRALRSQEVGSSLCGDSDVRLTSSSGRESGQTANSLKVDAGIHGATTCMSQVPCDSQNVRNGLKTSMLKVVDQVKVSKFSSNYPSGPVSETAGRYTVKGLFPYELFVKLYHWNKVELHPRGLINCGNSCYANAVLQCLAFTPPLTAYFLQGLHSKSCEKKEWCFTCEFESLIRKSKEGKSPLSAFRILSQIDKIGSNLGYGKEEDAHEFLRYAINNMQSVFLEEARPKTSGSFDEETTLTGLTFGGYLRSKIKCLKCGGKSERHERIMDLSVEIDGNICTLEEALRQFTCTEILDGENKYQCSRCKSYEKAKKKLTIVEAPNVLTIALKRFQSGKFGKLTKSIQFPEILNMAPYISGTSDKSPVYRLYGVVVHLDVMNSSFSGHYVCYVKNIQNNWFKIDDSTVNAVELETVLTKGAYMLLYARCSPRAPKLIRNSIVPRDPKKTKSTSFKSRSHSTGPCDALRTDSLNYRTRAEGFYPDQSSFQRIISPILEEDSSSENSSSFFSEAGSCSTESSTRDSTSADDYFDQIFGDLGHNWNSSWRNSSDSDTSSSSSSSSPPPVFSRHSPLSNSGHCSSKNPKSVPILCADVTKQCRKLDDSSSSSYSSSSSSSSSSCRETDSDRLGRLDPFNGVKSGISLRRSMRGRTD